MSSTSNSGQIYTAPSEKNDLYSLDKLFLNEFPSNEEVWDFGELVTLEESMISFLLMRALLFKEIKENKVKLENFNSRTKAKVANLGLSEFFTRNFKDIFIPTILGRSNIEKKLPSFYAHFSDSANFILEEHGKNNFYAGGGVFVGKQCPVQELVEELFIRYSLNTKKGTFYLRSSKNSYFYILNPENKTRIFYIQEKTQLEKNFSFFHIECESIHK